MILVSWNIVMFANKVGNSRNSPYAARDESLREFRQRGYKRLDLVMHRIPRKALYVDVRDAS